MRRRLVLVGGGHSHLHVLRMLGEAPLEGARVTLISPQAYSTYSGMVPGFLAGLYDLSELQIDLRALCTRAGVRFVRDHATRIETNAHRVCCETGTSFGYDLLSIDVGSVPRGAEDAAVRRFAVPLKPLSVAIERVEAFVATVHEDAGPATVAVVGAGAGGVEVAFAMAARLRGVQGCNVAVVERGPRPLAGYPPRVVERILRLFATHDIRYVGCGEVVSVGDGRLELRDGRRIATGLILWATGAAPPAFVRDSDLVKDGRGFPLVGDDLRSVSHADVFAAGDCATLHAYPDLPKAGVYAVREGPILAYNLRAALRGEGAVARYRPQRRFLSLLSTGDGRALLSYCGLALYGRWVWRLKDRIDRRFVDKHASPPRR